MGDFHALRRLGEIADLDIADRNIEHLVTALDEEMMMVGDVGVEIGAGTLDGKHTDEACLCELVQRIVYRGERNRNAGHGSLLVEFLDRQMAIALRKQQIGQRHALSRRAQATYTQSGFDIGHGLCHMAYAPRMSLTDAS